MKKSYKMKLVKVGCTEELQEGMGIGVLATQIIDFEVKDEDDLASVGFAMSLQDCMDEFRNHEVDVILEDHEFTREDYLKIGFFGDRRWLSNFYQHSFIDPADGTEYNSVEGYYQAQKTLDISDRRAIGDATPRKAKSLGQKVKLREDWDGIRIDVMGKALEFKFPGGDALSQKLLDTGDEDLVEHNWWGDTYWGRCEGEGRNMLGYLLEERRERLQEAQDGV